MDTTTHEARIRELDRELAPTSETALLALALESLRSADDPDADLAWWEGAYRHVAWSLEHPDQWQRLCGRGTWADAYEMVLRSGEDWDGWTPPPPPLPTSAEEYTTLRRSIGTQQHVADRLGVHRVTVAGRERGAQPIDGEAALALLALHAGLDQG